MRDSYQQPTLDKVTQTWYNDLVEVQKHMQYLVFNNAKEIVGTFESIYDMEVFLDGVREGRGESYPNTDRMSPFDYLKHIGWFMTINDQHMRA